MALIDKGWDNQFELDITRASIQAYREADLESMNDFIDSLRWLLEGAHKSDIGVIHRLIRDKLQT